MTATDELNDKKNQVCDRCGEQLSDINWWTAGVYDRFGGDKYRLCDDCAGQVRFAMNAVMELKGHIGGVMMR